MLNINSCSRVPTRLLEKSIRIGRGGLKPSLTATKIKDMKPVSFSEITKKIMALAVILAATFLFSSCDRLHEDLQPCQQGLRLRFVYDYNMEYANAFPSQVDCLTLLIYDKGGNYIRSVEAGRPQTADEDWRMTLDLPAGEYNLLAYGGMDCGDSSFLFSPAPNTALMQNLEVYLPSELITSPLGTDLHPLFYGQLQVSVPENTPGSEYTDATVYMMKDTNDIRVLLANESGLPTDVNDFVFSITDNNTRFNYENDIISTDNVVYSPWAEGNSEAGILPDGSKSIVSWAEFSVSRLMADSKATLDVVYKDNGKKVLSIPLVNILLLLKSERYANMQAQEFLDRQSRWNLTFFLTNDGRWAGVQIIINDWIVRINDISEL